MIKRLIIPTLKRLWPAKASPDLQLDKSDGVSSSRRRFFKRAAVGAVSITGTAGIAKTVVDSTITPPDMQDQYRRDALAGEQDLQSREFVVMSDKEKAEMVQSFIGSDNPS